MSSSRAGDAASGRSVPTEGGDLVCPACGATKHPRGERFCAHCAMPLVVAGDAVAAELPESEAHARARKIRPEYARGELERVAGGRNQAEAELIQGYLLEEGIPSLLRRSLAFDVPDFLAAGQRDVLVPASGAHAARELLAEADGAAGAPQGAARAPSAGALGRRSARIAAAIIVGALAAALVAWALARATL